MSILTTELVRRSAPGVGVAATKNRVWGFFGDGVKRTWEIDPQVVERHLEKTTARTTTAPGVPHWPSRDPIGELGGLNLYGFVGNDGVGKIDLLGLASCDVSCGGKPVGKLEHSKVIPTVGRKPESDPSVPIDAITTGVRITISLELAQNMTRYAKPCCCDNFQMLQVVKINSTKKQIEVPGSLNETMSPTTIDNNRPGAPNSPFYDDVFNNQVNNPDPQFPAVHQNPAVAIGDIPNLPDSYINRNGIKGDLKVEFFTYVVCQRANKFDRVLLPGLRWGYTRKKGSDGRYGPAIPIKPSCVGKREQDAINAEYPYRDPNGWVWDK